MKQFPIILCLLLTSMTTYAQEEPQAPVAEKIPTELKMHEQVRIDEYYWLRERENQKVIDYLNAENDYTKAMMASTDELQHKLTEETKARIKQTDTSVPYDNRGFTYYTRTEDGSQYTIYCRKTAGDDAAQEEVYLDVNQLAEGKDFCSVGGMSISDNNQILAYTVDFVGRRKYTLRFKDLKPKNCSKIRSKTSPEMSCGRRTTKRFSIPARTPKHFAHIKFTAMNWEPTLPMTSWFLKKRMKNLVAGLVEVAPESTS